MLFGWMLLTTAVAETGPVPINEPGTWVTSSDYPATAMTSEITGVTSFTLLIGPDGTVQDCTVTESSRSEVLDATTCTLVTQRARFHPAQDEHGKNVEGTYSNRVRWMMPAARYGIIRPAEIAGWPRPPVLLNTDDVLTRLYGGERWGEKGAALAFDVQVNKTGRATACRIQRSSGDAGLDRRTCDAMKETARFRPAEDVRGSKTIGRYGAELREYAWSTAENDRSRDSERLQLQSHRLLFDYDDRGTLTRCRVGEAGYEQEASCEPGMEAPDVRGANGKPMTRQVIVTINVHYDPID